MRDEVKKMLESVKSAPGASHRERAGTGGLRQTGIGFREDVLHRLDRLRACAGGISRTKIVEFVVLGHGLEATEAQFETEIKTFNRLAADEGITWQDYADWYAATFPSKTFPPGIDALCALAAAG